MVAEWIQATACKAVYVGSNPTHISMITSQTHLSNLLQEAGRYVLTNEDKNLIHQKGIEEYIFSKLLSKRFRKWKLTPTCETRTRKAIGLSVATNKPVHVVYFTGGYKLWRLPSSPQADWAEFFNIAHVLRYVAPIAATYHPGVTISYYVHTFLMEKHDNLTTEEIENYINSFQSLINAFLKYTSLNISVKIWKDADLYSRSEYFPILEDGYKKASEQYANMSTQQQNHFLKLGRLNIKWQGKEDWTSLPEIAKEEKIKQGAIWELTAMNNLDRVQQTAKGEDKVLLFTVGTPAFIGIGSTQNSIVKHWTGFGVLEKDNDKYRERILSPSQFEQIKGDPHTVEPINLLPFSNFATVWVYPNRLDFVR